MEAYAVIETGGKQYLVKPNDVIKIERLKAEQGVTAPIGAVLAISDGKTLRVGTPILESANVTGTILEHIRGPKLVSFKKKRRKGYKRTVGHRQSLTRVRIDSLAG